MSRLPFAALACSVVFALSGGEAAAARGKARIKFHPDWEKHPSTRYAGMGAAECTEELRRRKIDFVPVKRAPGVQIPVRLPKAVGGVVYRTEVAAPLRATNPYDVFDCRLVLALDDFSKVLRAHDIEEVLIFSAWRPPGKRWPDGRVGTRHPGALAIDAYRFDKKLGPGQTSRVWLDVLKDFHGSVGAVPCGSDAGPPRPSTKEARELRSIACEAADQHFFTAILTPNYNRAHRNHLHLELTPEVRWYLVR
jgi:Extensin-like protein C-terminus